MRRWFSRLAQWRNLTDPDLAGRMQALTDEAARYRKEAACRQHIGNVIARYFIKHERSTDIAIPFDSVKIDSNPDWIQGMLDRKELTEPEFGIFRFFAGNTGTVLDVGANFGYSVSSIWATAPSCRILSFEPNPWHVVCLQEIKRLRPGQYDFVHTGLGNRDDVIRFTVPVIEGIGISGLISAAIESETDWAIPENLLQHMFTYVPNVEKPQLQFAEVEWTVHPLDAILSARHYDVPLDEIIAVKMDVEGFEAEVIEGAIETIRHHRPLLMIEGANRNPAVVGPLQALGYQYADFQSERLVLSNQPSTQTSGFFLHGEKLDTYRQLGMVMN